MRPAHITLKSRFLYSKICIVPERVLAWLVARRLRSPEKNSHDETGDAKVDIVAEQDAVIASKKTQPAVDMNAIVNWQLQHHAGFVYSFMSSIRYAPILEQHDEWRIIGKRLVEQQTGSTHLEGHLDNGKVFILLGKDDPFVIETELKVDAEDVLGAKGVEWKVLDAGHEFPITRSREIVEALAEFWGWHSERTEM